MSTILSKLRIEEHKNYLTNIIYEMIVKVKLLDNHKSAHNSFKTKNRGTQKLFNRHYIWHDCEGKEVK